MDLKKGEWKLADALNYNDDVTDLLDDHLSNKIVSNLKAHMNNPIDKNYQNYE